MLATQRPSVNVVTGLTKAASFSLIGCLIAYKAFFYQKRQGRSILSPDLLIFIVVGVLFHLARNQWGYQQPTVYEQDNTPLQFTTTSMRGRPRVSSGIRSAPASRPKLSKRGRAPMSARAWAMGPPSVLRLSVPQRTRATHSGSG